MRQFVHGAAAHRQRSAPRGGSGLAGVGRQVPSRPPPVSGVAGRHPRGGSVVACHTRAPWRGGRWGGCAAAPHAPASWPVRVARWRDAPVPRALLHRGAERAAPGRGPLASAPQGLPGVARVWGGPRRRPGRGRAAGALSGDGPAGWRWRRPARPPPRGLRSPHPVGRVRPRCQEPAGHGGRAWAGGERTRAGAGGAPLVGGPSALAGIALRASPPCAEVRAARVLGGVPQAGAPRGQRGPGRPGVGGAAGPNKRLQATPGSAVGCGQAGCGTAPRRA